jgi:hypothetical protein
MPARPAHRAGAALLAAVATLVSAPARLAAQSVQASVRVSARVAALRPQLTAAFAPSPLRTPPAPPAVRHARAAGEIAVRAEGAYEVVVRRAPAGAGAAAAPIWTRDARGALRPLAAGGAVAVAIGGAGEHRVAAPSYRADRADQPVALTYEVRLVGATQ